MRHIIAHLKKERYFSFIYLSVFLLSLHFAFVVYINSSFLSTFFSERMVGVLFALGALLNISILLNISNILRRFGNFRTMLYFLLIDMVALFGLAGSHSAFWAGLFFVLFEGVAGMLLFNLDIFLETEIKTNLHIGGVRGIFLTMSNFAFVLSPFLVGQIIDTNKYSSIYLSSFFFAGLVLLIITSQFKEFKDSHYPVMQTRLALAHFIENRNLFYIYITNFILQFFYTVMVIYTPIYLHGTLGFSWETIGVMFSIMLLPFVFIEVPGGKFSDTGGEKKLLVFGLFMMGVSTLMLPFIGPDVLLWTALLFITRCGAALVEIMSESYFFKHVKGKDSNIIGFFRTSGSVAYILTPLFAWLFLTVFDVKYIYIIVGIVLLLSTRFARQIEDTV